ncbi:MAG: TetR/AcrR family transcriptional regulator [Candidatus Bathyarchaeota archaeon]|nr:MAG: TetR/AcrR family transcriptional regulator [Candidatus Bathyarchaeota archaeon]
MPKVVPEYKEQARMRIIETALEMFSERGFYRTRMSDIASNLGVSKGAIYQYFESKEQLFVEVLRHHGERRARVVRGFLESGSLMSISTGEFFDEMLELRLGSLELSIDLLRETARNEALRKMLVGIAEGWGQGLVKLIEEMKSDGKIRADVDFSSLSRGILALRDGLYSHLMMGADRNEVRKTWVVIMGYLMNDVLT